MLIADASSDLLIALTAALLAGAIAALLVTLHLAARRRAETARLALQRELATLREEARASGAAVAALAGRIDRLSDSLDTDRRRAEPPRRGDGSYELAIRLARGGAGVDELVTACGMSRREAELVARLHGAPPAAAKAATQAAAAAAAAAATRGRLAVVAR